MEFVHCAPLSWGTRRPCGPGNSIIEVERTISRAECLRRFGGQITFWHGIRQYCEWVPDGWSECSGGKPLAGEDKSTAQLMGAFYQTRERNESRPRTADGSTSAREQCTEFASTVGGLRSHRRRGPRCSNSGFLASSRHNILATALARTSSHSRCTGRDGRCGTAQAQRGARHQIRLTPTKPWGMFSLRPTLNPAVLLGRSLARKRLPTCFGEMEVP